MKLFVIGLSLVLLGVVFLLFVSGPERTLDHSGEESQFAPPPLRTDDPPVTSSRSAEAGKDNLTVLPIAHTTSALNTQETSANEDLLVIEALLEQFRRHHGGNPVGDNDDIVAALRGRNPKTLAYLPAGHPALDSHGQLLDRWGTPYHFHALSGMHMAIRSAGPDRKLWSEDDLMLSP